MENKWIIRIKSQLSIKFSYNLRGDIVDAVSEFGWSEGLQSHSGGAVGVQQTRQAIHMRVRGRSILKVVSSAFINFWKKLVCFDKLMAKKIIQYVDE